MHNYADLGNGKFRNPILFADYSDPDVIRVSDTYYMTASSFNYTPGLPILISKDLVNWKLVNYAIKNIKEDRFDIPRHSQGVWAPAIRFHDGFFYIFYAMPDEGCFFVRTRDPLGDWEEPVCILPGKGLIDTCPIWDDDGRAYVIHGYAKSRIGFNSIIGIFEIDPNTLKAISEDHFIFDGNDPKHPAKTIEGPKVYKRNGYYYIWAPAGGVKYGYQLALRSRNIFGPYEIKEVMHKGNSIINGPHQGGLTDTVNGDEWFIHFQDRGLYGRICHLQPVTWKEDWPVIGVNPDENNCGEPVFEMEKPNTGLTEEPSYLEASDSFADGKIGLCWQWLGNHKDSFYTRVTGDDNQEKDGIRLKCINPSKDKEPIIWRSANVLTQKLIYPMFETTFEIDASNLTVGDRAGVCMMGGQYFTAYIKRISDTSYSVVTAESAGDDNDKKEVTDKEFDLGPLCEKAGYDSMSEALKNICFVMRFDYDDDKVTSKDLYFQDLDKPYNGVNPTLKTYLCIKDYSGKDQHVTDLGIKYQCSDHTWVGAKTGVYAFSGGNDINDDQKTGFADLIKVTTKSL